MTLTCKPDVKNPIVRFVTKTLWWNFEKGNQTFFVHLRDWTSSLGGHIGIGDLFNDRKKAADSGSVLCKQKSIKNIIINTMFEIVLSSIIPKATNSSPLCDRVRFGRVPYSLAQWSQQGIFWSHIQPVKKKPILVWDATDLNTTKALYTPTQSKTGRQKRNSE